VLADHTLNGGTFTAVATATSGNAVTFTSATAGVCTVTSQGVVTMVAAGTCTILADQAGSRASGYAAANRVSQSFTVWPALVFNAPASGLSVTYGNNFLLQLMASGGTGHYSYAVAAGTLPAGLTLDSTTGLISGVTTATSPATVAVTATDSNNAAASTGNFTLTITGVPQSSPTVDPTPVGPAPKPAPKNLDPADWPIPVEGSSNAGAWKFTVTNAAGQSLDSLGAPGSANGSAGSTLVLLAGEKATVAGTGFLPMSTVKIWFFPESKLVATLMTDANGAFTTQISVDAAAVIGAHDFIVQALENVDQLGTTQVHTAQVCVQVFKRITFATAVKYPLSFKAATAQQNKVLSSLLKSFAGLSQIKVTTITYWRYKSAKAKAAKISKIHVGILKSAVKRAGIVASVTALTKHRRSSKDVKKYMYVTVTALQTK
jgi:hypothetical protein